MVGPLSQAAFGMDLNTVSIWYCISFFTLTIEPPWLCTSHSIHSHEVFGREILFEDV
jgi:hypothetical protein